MKNAILKTSCLTLTLVSLLGCGSSTTLPEPTAPGPAPTTPEPQSEGALFKGMWLNKSLGEMLIVNENDFSVYQFTQDNCLQIYQHPLADLTSQLGEVTVDNTTETLHTQRQYELETHHYTKQTQQLDACRTAQLTAANNDPVLNFSWFWQSIEDYYAGFSVREVDWPKIKADSLNALAGGADQWTVFSDALDQLADPHAMLISAEYGFKQSAQYTTLHYQLAEEINLAVNSTQVNDVLAQRLETAGQLVINQYLGESARLLQSDQVIYGQLNHQTAYINLRSMNFDGDDNQHNHDKAQQVAALLLDNLADKNQLVIDLRFNLGGNVLAAKVLADALAIQAGEAYQMAYKHGDGFSPQQSFNTQPSGLGYHGSIFILTSPLTGSAAEALIYFLSAGNDVQLLGETTRGIQSGPSSRYLPNGWVLNVPNRKITGPDGDYLENSGFTPDIRVPTFTATDQLEGVDTVLESVLAM